MKINIRPPLLLFALAMLALAMPTPCAAQTTVRLSPHSVSTYDPLRGTCTITSADDGFEAMRPEPDVGATDAGILAGILVTDYAAAGSPASRTTAAYAATTAAARPNKPARNDHARRGRAVDRNRRTRAPSAETRAAHDPPPSTDNNAGAPRCYLGSRPREAILPGDLRRLIPDPARRGEQRDLQQTLHASSHPEDKTDPYAADRPAYAVRI